MRARAFPATVAFLALLFLPLSISTVQAQVTAGSITGTVVDPSGRPIPGATVVASDSLRASTRTAVSDEEGRYREALAAKLGLAEYVHFLGYRDDVMMLMKKFDLYLMTSHFESFGLTLIEAMGSGVPVVAAKAEGPFEEIIEHGVDGILADNRNPRLIADAIIQLLQDEKLRTKLGSAAQKKVTLKYTMASNARAIYDCYKSVSSTLACGKRA